MENWNSSLFHPRWMPQLMNFKVSFCSLKQVSLGAYGSNPGGFTSGSCVCAAHMANTGPRGQIGFTSQEKRRLALRTEMPAAPAVWMCWVQNSQTGYESICHAQVLWGAWQDQAGSLAAPNRARVGGVGGVG